MKKFALYCMLGLSMFILSCEDDVMVEDPVASFQFEIDDTDFLTVHFTNFSTDADSYDWDFGDGNTSTDESPSHTYDAGGDYTVTLTASNSEGTEATRSESITVTDPGLAAKLLTGESSKTWKLYREGTAMSLGPDAENPAQWWEGLTNDGSRPCLYLHEFTFNTDGTYDFDDMGMFWAEFGVFNNVDGCDENIISEQCFEIATTPLVNACGDDVSAWGSGTHNFAYDPSTGELTLTGDGAWIGIPKLGTTGERLVPESSTTTQITIEEMVGFDVMKVEYTYDGAYWVIYYASYSDASLEPDLVTEEEPFGEDLDDITPDFLGHTFAEPGTSSIDTIPSGTQITFGVDDPAGGGNLVGEFYRTTAQFQELQFQTSPEKNDIVFENMSTATVDVYFPSSNDYSGTLTKNVIIGFADASQTEQWWTDIQQYEMDGSALAEDEWHTITFDLNSPTFVANPDNGSTPYDRNDFDMIFLNIGSGGHTADGTFYVRNLVIE